MDWSLAGTMRFSPSRCQNVTKTHLIVSLTFIPWAGSSRFPMWNFLVIFVDSRSSISTNSNKLEWDFHISQDWCISFHFKKFLSFLPLIFKSFSEFAVSTRILRNETLATRSYHDDDFKVTYLKLTWELGTTYKFRHSYLSFGLRSLY